jgi:hypothetical protein
LKITTEVLLIRLICTAFYNGVTEWATHHEVRGNSEANNVYLSRQMDVTKITTVTRLYAVSSIISLDTSSSRWPSGYLLHVVYAC